MSILYVVATPIGNLEDLSHRAVRILGESDAVACEDTRQTRKIYERYSIPRPSLLFSYHEHNERSAGRRILSLLREGKSVALCSDAGYPGVSDPGYRIVSDAWEQGFQVCVIPGAGAVTAALLASGLPTSSFTFKGFAPKKSGQRRRFLAAEKEAPHTLVLFESPHRVAALLKDALGVLGDRLAAVCVELTKRFESTSRAHLSSLAAEFEGRAVRGEVTVVIAGNNPKFIRESE